MARLYHEINLVASESEDNYNDKRRIKKGNGLFRSRQ